MVTEIKTFQFIGGNLALDFCNTVHSVGNDEPEDDLETWADLLNWGKQAGFFRQDTYLPGRSADLARFKELRANLFEMFSALAAGREPGPEAMARFNAHLHAALAHAHMQQKDGRYSLTSRAKNSVEQLHFEVIRTAVDLLTSGSFGRIRVCAGQSCTWLFMDTSRNGSRRWCEMKSCGNREKIRRFRRHSHH